MTEHMFAQWPERVQVWSPRSSGARRPARELFEATAVGDKLPEFLTLPAYDRLK